MATINSTIANTSIPRANKPTKITPDAAAGTFEFKVPGHGITTTAGKDDKGDTWYYTQGGQWRNTRTNKVNPLMPKFIAGTPAATTPPPPAVDTGAGATIGTPPADVSLPAGTPNPSDPTKGFWEFMPQGETLAQLLAPWTNLSKEWENQKSQGVDPAIQAEIDRINGVMNVPMRTSDQIRASLQPAYDLERDRGLQKQAMMLAAKGLVGSGAEDTQNRELIADNSARLGEQVAAAIAADQDRWLKQQQIGTETVSGLLARDRELKEAREKDLRDKIEKAKLGGLEAAFSAAGSGYSDYLNLGLTEAQRKERESNETWDRQMQSIQTLLSFLPPEQVLKAIESSAGLDKSLGDTLADLVSRVGQFAGVA